MSERLVLPHRRHHVTQKTKIAGQRTLYISVHDDEQPAEIFLRVKGRDGSSELLGLYDVVARLMCIASTALRLRRLVISSLGLHLRHAAPSLDMIASSIVRMCRVSSAGIY